MKPYKLGITVGRFQTFHNGHRSMIEKAIELCDRTCVFIGSSQEYGTSTNPYTYETRCEILRRIFGDEIEIYPLPDIGVGNNSKWGEYVLRTALDCCKEKPDLLVSGKESRRVDWFDGIEDFSISELYIPKTIDISASQMREFLAENDFENWKKYSDEKIWNCFDSLREAVLASKDKTETASL